MSSYRRGRRSHGQRGMKALKGGKGAGRPQENPLFSELRAIAEATAKADKTAGRK